MYSGSFWLRMKIFWSVQLSLSALSSKSNWWWTFAAMRRISCHAKLDHVSKILRILNFGV